MTKGLSKIKIEKWKTFSPITRYNYWREHMKSETGLLNHLIEKYPDFLNEKLILKEYNEFIRDKKSNNKEMLLSLKEGMNEMPTQEDYNNIIEEMKDLTNENLLLKRQINELLFMIKKDKHDFQKEIDDMKIIIIGL